ncbi:MAG: membrane dipeptidase [Ruminococcus sp.]|nr:membrane dipeptidase [Ruminococcus sp.]
MRVFDLHCDTVYRATAENSSLSDPRFEINIDKALRIERYKQLAAVWIPDEYRGEKAVELFRQCLKTYYRDRLFSDTHRMYLSVEGGAVLAGNMDNLSLLTENNAKALTLTWNGENEIGGGAYSGARLTSFGKEAVNRLEKNHIAVDVSHANEATFYDVLRIAKKPIIATHSNSKSVADSPRNLTDDQFREIIATGGIVGLTYHNAFLNTDPASASINDLLYHADRFLHLGGEEHLCLGSDFDGGELPLDFHGLEDMRTVEEMLTNAFSKEICDKIFYKNAEKFFQTL